MKVFFKQEILSKKIPRHFLSEWVKPLFPEPRHSLYGLEPLDLEYSQQQSGADAFVLPFTWNYYFDRKKIRDAMDLIKEYQHWNKPIYTWAVGDYTLKIPEGGFILFRQSGYQAYRRKNEHACPVIIRDPLDYLNLPKIKILPKEQKPKISFCGLAEKNWIEGNWWAIKNSMFKMVNSIRKPYLDLSHPISGTELRRKVLKLFSSSNEVRTNFLIRSSSGGHKINSKTHKLEFWENMQTSPYILCVRGVGNFSARFYEALAMGRIPVLVNTDCILPLDNKINWENHCVWVESEDCETIVNKLNSFHEKLSKYEFEKLQIINRQLWFDNLTFGSFFKNNVFQGLRD